MMTSSLPTSSCALVYCYTKKVCLAWVWLASEVKEKWVVRRFDVCIVNGALELAC